MLSYLEGFCNVFISFFRYIFSSKEVKNTKKTLVKDFNKFLTNFYEKASADIEFFSQLYFTKEDGFFIVYFVKYPESKEDLKIFFYFSEEIFIEYNKKSIKVSGELTKQKYLDSLIELRLAFSQDEEKFIKETRRIYTPMIKLYLGEKNSVEEDCFYDIDGINELVYSIALTDSFYDVYLFLFYHKTEKITLKMPGVSKKEFEIKEFTRDEIRGFVEEMKGVGSSENATWFFFRC